MKLNYANWTTEQIERLKSLWGGNTQSPNGSSTVTVDVIPLWGKITEDGGVLISTNSISKIKQYYNIVYSDSNKKIWASFVVFLEHNPNDFLEHNSAHLYKATKADTASTTDEETDRIFLIVDSTVVLQSPYESGSSGYYYKDDLTEEGMAAIQTLKITQEVTWSLS